MFEPSFLITQRMLKLVGRIEASKAILSVSTLTPDWDLRFRDEAFLRNVFFTARLMGVSMTASAVEKVVKDDPSRDETPVQVATRLGIVVNEAQMQLVMNLRNAYRYADQIARLGKRMGGVSFGEKELSAIHTIMSERIVPSHLLGVVRMSEAEEFVGLGNEISPLGVECSYQYEDWLRWLGGVSKDREWSEMLVWPVVLAEMLRIRPFVKNNLGVGLVFLLLIMTADEINPKGYLAIAEKVNGRWNKMAEGYKDLVVRGVHTKFIEEFLAILDEVMGELVEKVRRLAGDVSVVGNFAKQVALSERQMALLSVVQMRESLGMTEARQVLPSVSDDTILRDLKTLVEKKLIKKKGKTKGARYVLVR